eukprot:1834501-Rhodomonas_salina.2
MGEDQDPGMSGGEMEDGEEEEEERERERDPPLPFGEGEGGEDGEDEEAEKGGLDRGDVFQVGPTLSCYAPPGTDSP